MKNVLDDVVRAGHAISRGFDIRYFIASLVEQLFDITGVNLACFYSLEGDRARLLFRRGLYDIPELLSPEEDPFQFVLDSRETVVLTERKESPFLPLLLHREMNSGVLSPLLSGSKVDAFIILNSRDPQFFDRQRLRFTEALVKLAGEFYHNTVLHNRLREYTRKIQALERYQENIFTSMTNLLLTTDTEGHIRYYNRAAGEKFSLNPEDVGKTIGDVLGRGMGRKMLGVIDSSIGEGEEIVGAEGIYRGEKEEMDFSLTTAPLVTRRQKHEGLTLIFTDQSRERELEKKVKSVKEERRLIKDMFSRYLSQEIVSQMVRNPDIVHLGGDKKVATVMFADIRGYTAFSEGRDPEFIIKILNEYFSEAVELVIQNRGYIDKFIGDCIMAPISPFPAPWTSRS
jgi:adenylate cyclase